MAATLRNRGSKVEPDEASTLQTPSKHITKKTNPALLSGRRLEPRGSWPAALITVVVLIVVGMSLAPAVTTLHSQQGPYAGSPRRPSARDRIKDATILSAEKLRAAIIDNDHGTITEKDGSTHDTGDSATDAEESSPEHKAEVQ